MILFLTCICKFVEIVGSMLSKLLGGLMSYNDIKTCYISPWFVVCIDGFVDIKRYQQVCLHILYITKYHIYQKIEYC